MEYKNTKIPLRFQVTKRICAVYASCKASSDRNNTIKWENLKTCWNRLLKMFRSFSVRNKVTWKGTFVCFTFANAERKAHWSALCVNTKKTFFKTKHNTKANQNESKTHGDQQTLWVNVRVDKCCTHLDNGALSN